MKKNISENVDEFGLPISEDVASYDHRDTGLPMNVIILSRSGERHGPRVKFQQDYGQRLKSGNDHTTSLTVTADPKVPRDQRWRLTTKDFLLAREFILKNKDLLLKYWRGELLTRELESSLMKIASSSRG